MVATTADATAARTWVEDGATSQDHTAALLKNRLYRRWGIKTAREYARIKIDGLRLVGGRVTRTSPLPPGPVPSGSRADMFLQQQRVIRFDFRWRTLGYRISQCHAQTNK